MKEAINGLENIAQQTNNDVILFFIVLLVGIPLIVLYLRAQSNEKHTRHKEQMERDKQLLEVISQNSTVISELSTIMRTNQLACIECKNEQVAHLNQISAKMDNATEVVADLRSKASLLISQKESGI